jgi:hypothetical protein
LIWVVSLVGLAVVFLVIVCLLFVVRSRDNGQFDRGEGGFSDKYGRGLRDDQPRQAAKAAREPENLRRAAAVAEIVSIDRIKQGDLVQISESVAGQSNINFVVSGVNRYETGQGGWREFFGNNQGRTVYLEVFPDDGSQVGVVFSDRMLTLDRVGLTEEELIGWDEGGAASGSLEYDGESWEFEWSGETSSTSIGSSTQESYYGWDFIGRGGRRTLCIEKREGDPFEVCLVHLIDVDRIHVTRD